MVVGDNYVVVFFVLAIVDQNLVGMGYYGLV